VHCVKKAFKLMRPCSFILGRHWHKEHSECQECHRPIGHDNFAEIEGLLYCSDHHINVNGMAVKNQRQFVKTRSGWS